MPNLPHIKINLTGRGKESLTQDFLKWSVNVGRIIIVFTELIAMAALLYRFTLDRKIIDLHDEIKKAELFVASQDAKENDYRSIQSRLANIKNIQEATQIKISIMNDILKSISSGAFSSTNLTVNPSRININGVAFSVFPLNNFIESLKKNPDVTSISLDEISSAGQGIQFKLTIELSEEKKI